MTDKVTKYPKTLAALASVEGTIWGVADALLGEIVVTQKGVARAGQYAAVSKEAAAVGLVNPTSGQPYSESYLGHLYEVAKFANDALESGAELRRFPVRRVLAAKHQAKGNLAKTLEILGGGQTMHAIAGTSPLGKGTPVITTPEQATQAVKGASTKARKRMVQEALLDPEVARELAEEGEVQDTLIEAKLDVAHRKATGKPVRPTGTKDQPVEEEEGQLRKGLAFLAIGTPLYRAQVNVIEATGHARESSIEDSTRRLLEEQADALIERVVDLKLVLAGEKEVTDEDIAAWLKQAESDAPERR